MSRRSIVIVITAATCVALGAFAVSSAVRPRAGLAGWVLEVRGADEDRGWDLVGDDVRDAYGGDRAAYLADVAAADWIALELGPTVEVWERDGFAMLEAAVRSSPDTVPAFLFERRIVHGVCDQGGYPTGIGAFEDRRPFAGRQFVGGGLTGSQARCNAAFSDPRGRR